MPPGAVIVGFAVGGAAGIAERMQLEVGFMHDAYVVLIIAVVAAVVAILVVVLARRGKGELERRLAVEEERSSRIPGLDRSLLERTEQITDLRARLAALQETLDQERKQAVEKVALLSDAKERMTQEFKLLATDVMQLHGENFSKQNKEQIETVLAPLREKLGEFQQGIQAAHTESTKERATLAEQIRQLTESSAKMTTETNSLTRALRGETQTQGA